MSGGPKDILRMDGEDIDKKIQAFLKRVKDKKLKNMRWLMSTPEGRRIAYMFLEECQTFLDAYAVDVNLTHINLGKKTIGNWFLALLDEASPTAYSQMVREHRSEMATQKEIINKIKEGKSEGEN